MQKYSKQNLEQVHFNIPSFNLITKINIFLNSRSTEKTRLEFGDISRPEIVAHAIHSPLFFFILKHINVVQGIHDLADIIKK
jgi:hypothetical protein